MRIPLPALALLVACAGPRTTPAPLVVLVSFDTTRADALGCYGAPDARTPTVDALAEQGVRFAWAMSSSSTTLAAHTAVMSGEDSHGHAVPRNGFPVRPDLPLLAERFSDQGWHTVAAVGSYALEHDMGLSRGFARYEDHAGWQAAVFGLYEVNGREVTDSALALVDTRPADTPVFLFVHYYDPHMPWTSAPDHIRAPFVDPDYRGRAGGDRAGIGHLTEATLRGALTDADRSHARGLYLAEVAWADRQLARLLRGLGARGLLQDSLVVVFSDHGEVFDEVPERPFRHGPDVDLPIVHVPLVVRGTGRFATPSGQVVEPTVRTLDIGSTVLAAAGDPRPLGSGRDLAAWWSPSPPSVWPLAFAEATKPLEHLRTDVWPNADLERVVVDATHMVSRAPWLGTGDQTFLRTTGQPPSADPRPDLHAALDAFDARAPGARQAAYDAETRSALEALGYLDD